MTGFRHQPRSRGAVLILGLVILLVMTMVGVAAIQTTALEERMAGNMRQRDLALHAAEAAAQLAATLIQRQVEVIPPTDTGTYGVWRACELTDSGSSAVCTAYSTRLDHWASGRASTAGDKTYADIATLTGYADDLTINKIPGVAKQPRVAIESQFVPDLPVDAASKGGGVHYYKITALGFGADENARAIVETVIARRYL